MNLPKLPSWLIRVAIMAIVPTIACSAYYSVEYLGRKEATWTLPVILAYPLALISLIGLAAELLSPQRSKLKLGFSAFFFIVPLAFLLLVRM